MGLQQGRCVAGVLALMAALGLSGCLDVDQRVGIDRSGSGRYEIAASAQGIVGDALKNEKLVNKQNRATLTTAIVGSRVTRVATVDFKSLSDLAFSDETMSLNVRGRDLFGLGPTHVAYVADVMIGKAKNENARAASTDSLGEKVAQSILGEHTYTFTVTVPGDVESAVPVTLGGTTYQPLVTGDFYNGRTVTWRIPLYALVDARALRFEVDFWAWGFFNDSHSQLVAND